MYSISYFNELKMLIGFNVFMKKISLSFFFILSLVVQFARKIFKQGFKICPVRSAVQNLQDLYQNKMDKQNITMSNAPTKKKNTGSSINETDLCHSFKMLSLSATKLLSSNASRDSSFLSEASGNLEKPDTDSEIEESFRELVDSHKDSLTCPEIEEGFRKLVDPHKDSLTYSEIEKKFSKLVSSHKDKLTCPEIEESFSKLLDSHKDSLTCRVCGESIIIYNENVDFSLDLHMQKHKTLSSINSNNFFSHQQDADYVCPICTETIQVFNKDLEFSYNIHFDNNHKHDRDASPVVETRNRFDFLSRVFENLPGNMREQQKVFVMDGNEVVCKLCNCIVSSTKHVPNACKVFSKHILNSFHIDQYNFSAELMAEAVNMKSLPHKKINQQINMLERLSKKNLIINENKQFIEKQKVNYICTICDKYICYSPNEYIQISNFVSHLNSKLHEKSLKKIKIEKRNTTVETKNCTNPKNQINSNSSSDAMKMLGNKMSQTNPKKQIDIFASMLKKSPVLEAHKHFIGELKGRYWCTICGIPICYSPKEDTQILNFFSHLKGYQHMTSLNRTKKQAQQNTRIQMRPSPKAESNRQSSSHSNNLDSKSVSQNETKIQNVVENAVTDMVVFENHKQFVKIDQNKNYCTLCDKHMSYSSNKTSQIFNLVLHFKGYIHLKNFKHKVKNLNRNGK